MAQEDSETGELSAQLLDFINDYQFTTNTILFSRGTRQVIINLKGKRNGAD